MRKKERRPGLIDNPTLILKDLRVRVRREDEERGKAVLIDNPEFSGYTYIKGNDWRLTWI